MPKHTKDDTCACEATTDKDKDSNRVIIDSQVRTSVEPALDNHNQETRLKYENACKHHLCIKQEAAEDVILSDQNGLQTRCSGISQAEAHHNLFLKTSASKVPILSTLKLSTLKLFTTKCSNLQIEC